MNKSGFVLIQPTVLYNILQQQKFYPCLSDPNYLILLDLRKEADYYESHIITARRPTQETDGSPSVPYGSELECKQHVVVYDSKTFRLSETDYILKYAQFLWQEGSRYPVKILAGGYQRFSALYPYLRTQKILYTIRELDEMPTYPYEIFHARLYFGTFNHATRPHIQKELNITAHISCSQHLPPKNKRIVSVLHIPKGDDSSTDLYPYFHEACDFIVKSRTVLIFSELGISRSVTILLAYLMKSKKWNLKEAYSFVKSCCQFIRPLCTFLCQLSKWEEEIGIPKNTPVTEADNTVVSEEI